MTDIIDGAAMALSAGLLLFGIVGMGLLELLVGAPYGPVPLTNEAGDATATPMIRRRFRPIIPERAYASERGTWTATDQSSEGTGASATKYSVPSAKPNVADATWPIGFSSSKRADRTPPLYRSPATPSRSPAAIVPSDWTIVVNAPSVGRRRSATTGARSTSITR